ncbi:MAG: bifunctional diaminohydroxyphosphoribosylaminopyrimidine deaminase/5-amino-6-(5-phosphoribosylamino)uracil reductase RibD [Bacteroidia bacterium]|nr:bifunctional diaminohydroxyphosphoribosylaminopyrimidine deaminase/5-amino-6-(5-phosphoribosylamino)uracil reductase RibD [Bacteroidia bacterium]MCX7652627.1 bifunctional diaminohydroxyphosphoribosylaminopyrimidine deaminase/5-amino-6-(5-phosphoribosylamino)uracil reductase RibD [Bacteroidia bacterium]MDW8417020.1 bifunctional diaminohydroxyphosphoribosylaminopyrimidine deaminase/5-amino-6-(5-phosphoribosylamino)uracil reductase RibD [Bacteroidia bacterium]
MNHIDALWLRRALELARRSIPSSVEPNPPVGAVIAIDSHLLGEGYHRAFGGPHAEIEALHSVKDALRLPDATLYVTLEPCCHTEKKTPPCVPEIISSGIRRVVIGCKDPNPAVTGKGIRALREAGIDVLLAPQSAPFEKLIRHFKVNVQQKRPYITLKWAQANLSDDLYDRGFIGSRTVKRWAISSFWGKVWGHKLRARHSHIAVGYGTWRLDTPALTTRYFPGANPKPLIFYEPERGIPPQADERFMPLEYPLHALLRRLYEEFRVGSILVEGGASLLNRFIAAGLYDEVHVLVRLNQKSPPSSVLAPVLPNLRWKRFRLMPDEVVLSAYK